MNYIIRLSVYYYILYIFNNYTIGLHLSSSSIIHDSLLTSSVRSVINEPSFRTTDKSSFTNRRSNHRTNNLRNLIQYATNASSALWEVRNTQ